MKDFVEHKTSFATEETFNRSLASDEGSKNLEWKEVAFLDNPKLFRLIKPNVENKEQRTQKIIASVNVISDLIDTKDLPDQIEGFEDLEEMKKSFFTKTLIKDWNPEHYLYDKKQSYAILFLSGTYFTEQKEFFVEWHVYHKNTTTQILFNSSESFKNDDHDRLLDLLKISINNLDEIDSSDKNDIQTVAKSLRGQIKESSSEK